MIIIEILLKRFWQWFNRVKSTGLVPQSIDERDYVYKDTPTTSSLSVSLRDKMGPVRNQEPFEACTAYATGALFDYVAAYKKDMPWHDFDYSEAYQWYYSRLDEGKQDENVGVQLRNCFKTIMKYGFVPQSVWDFEDGWRKKPDKNAEISASFYKLYLSQFKGYFSIYPGNTASIKNALNNGFPVVFGFPVTSEFMKLKGKNFYDEIKGGIQGYHAMLITGYGVDGFEVRNSWGKKWGDEGYTIISEELVRKKAFDLWTLQ